MEDMDDQQLPEEEPTGSEGAPEEQFRERDRSLCPCKSKREYRDCCRRFHRKTKVPETAEELMRSRYSAYFFRLVDYLVETTHPDTREKGLKASLAKMIHQPTWRFLTIEAVAKGGKEDKTGKVEFTAEYFIDGEQQELHEISRFRRYKGVWKYLDGKS